MSDQPGMINVGDVYDLEYWCDPRLIFSYLDSVSPLGSKFKCPVCGGNQWGSSTVEAIDPDGNTRPLVTPCAFPVSLPDGSKMQMMGREYPNFHYAVVCLTCTNTIFLNSAMVQAKIKAGKSQQDGS